MPVAVAAGLPRAPRPAGRRAGGFAPGYAVAAAASGGSTQVAAAGLFRLTGDPLGPAWCLLAALVVGLLAMRRFPDTRSRHAPESVARGTA